MRYFTSSPLSFHNPTDADPNPADFVIRVASLTAPRLPADPNTHHPLNPPTSDLLASAFRASSLWVELKAELEEERGRVYGVKEAKKRGSGGEKRAHPRTLASQIGILNLRQYKRFIKDVSGRRLDGSGYGGVDWV